jgi:predicted aldo/keto reductase-like oxidoreductase
MDKKHQDINRREFLKRLGLGTASAFVISAAGPLSAWAQDDKNVMKVVGTMTYRKNHHSGDNVSLLGYGMMRLPMKDRKIDQELVNQEIDYALEHGVNYFDTSPHYCNGKSEEAMGIALSRHPRSSYYVATKMSNFGQDEWSAEASKAMYHRSMELLKTDHLDYYLLHGIGMGGMDAFKGRFLDNGMLDYLVEERKAGRIRNLGFSYHGDVAVFDWLLAHNDQYHWDFAQIEMNYHDWHHAGGGNTNAEYLYTECEKRGIQNVVMEPLFGGRLAKLPEAQALKLKAKRPNDTVASWAFRYVGSFSNILTALSGMTTMNVLQENVNTYSPLDPCTSAEIAMLGGIADDMVAYPTIGCTACRYCMPCPYGVDIPGNFAFYNKAVNEGTLPPADKKAADYTKRARAFAKAYKKALPEKSLASACMDCKACMPKCPQHIHIPDNMAKLTDLLNVK